MRIRPLYFAHAPKGRLAKVDELKLFVCVRRPGRHLLKRRSSMTAASNAAVSDTISLDTLTETLNPPGVGGEFDGLLEIRGDNLFERGSVPAVLLLQSNTLLLGSSLFGL